MKTLISTVTACLLLTSCAAPVSYTNAPMAYNDKDSEYAIEETAFGFILTVNYSRYQFIPESSATATACKAALTSIAWKISDQRHREIETINEQRIAISMGRNSLSGVTSCSAQAPITWKR